MSSANSWVERFRGLSDPKFIRRASIRHANPILNIGALPVEEACARLEAEFKEIFIPTDSAVELLVMKMERAAGHAAINYPDERAFLARCYDIDLQIEPDLPLCVSGLAGVGKSQILKALYRILPKTDRVAVHQHGYFDLVAGKRVVINSQKSVLEVLKSLARPGLTAKSLQGETAWVHECRQWLYQNGVCDVSADEMQFLTLSSGANALVSRLLMTLNSLGIPFSFNCNYSLGHKLKKRNQEDKQRLVARPHVLHPDSYDSDAWSDVLMEYAKAAPDAFDINFSDARRTIWSLTAGIMRLLSQLLVLAYRQARRRGQRSATMDDLSRAYHSAEFSSNREDVEYLFVYGQNGSDRRKDLCCPFPTPGYAAEKYAQALQVGRKELVATAVVQASMTQQEREAFKSMEAAAVKGSAAKPSKTTNVVRLKNRGAKTLAALKEAGRTFSDNLK